MRKTDGSDTSEGEYRNFVEMREWGLRVGLRVNNTNGA